MQILGLEWLDARLHMLQEYKGYGHTKSWAGFVLGIRKTLNNRIYSQTKLEDEMPIDVKQIDDEDFEVTFFYTS